MMPPAEGSAIEIQPFLSDHRVVVVDVETTGFDRIQDRVIELGVLWIERGELVMALSRTFNPGVKLPKEIIELTGISQEEVDRSPPFSRVAPFVVDVLSDPSVVVAYNSSFDLSFLRHEIERAGAAIPKLGAVLDPLRWVRNEDRGMRCNLGLAAERRNISSNGAHRALADCWITLAVMNKLKMPETLSEALREQRRGFQ